VKNWQAPLLWHHKHSSVDWIVLQHGGEVNDISSSFL